MFLIFTAQRKGFGGTDLSALTAGDTFSVADPPAIHQAITHTKLAACAFASVHLHTKNSQSVEQAVKSTQRAEEAAKGPINKDCRHNKNANNPAPVQTMQVKKINIASKEQQDHIFKV